MEKIAAIVGDGQMGLVLSEILHLNGFEVRLWGPFPEELDDLAATRRSRRRLPDFTIPDAVQVTGSTEALLDGATVVLNAIPTQYIRKVWEGLRPSLPQGVLVACVAKGIENKTLLLPTRIIAEVVGPSVGPLVCVSGPTIAAELAAHLPATVVAACEEAAAADEVQSMLNIEWLRVYTNQDAIGVEIAGATKNVIALAAGMVDGLELGANAKSALLARGLAEIVRLGVASGARQETFFGIAGVGDLATTCFSPLGRNRTCGERLARGESLREIFQSSAFVVEGVPTTESVMQLAANLGIEMPIATAVHGILFQGLSPGAAISQLMTRQPKRERIG